MEPLLIAGIIIIILIIINYTAEQNKKNNIKNNKVIEVSRIPTLEEQCEIEYFPVSKIYAPKCKGKYIFKTQYGTYHLHSSPSYLDTFKTEEEARNRIAEFLEWNGKDIQTIKY